MLAARVPDSSFQSASIEIKRGHLAVTPAGKNVFGIQIKPGKHQLSVFHRHRGIRENPVFRNWNQ
jgi:hypothetical protein